jgi:hypothetical protein
VHILLLLLLLLLLGILLLLLLLLLLRLVVALVAALLGRELVGVWQLGQLRGLAGPRGRVPQVVVLRRHKRQRRRAGRGMPWRCGPGDQWFA